MGLSFEEFITETNEASSPEAVFRAFETALRDQGFDRVIYSLITDHPSLGRKAGHGLQRNYPEDWMRHYQHCGYEKVDPVPKHAFRTSKAFSWQTLVQAGGLSAAELAVMNEAEEAGLRDGVGIPIYGVNGEIAGIGLASSIGGADATRDNLDLLRAMAVQFHLAYGGKSETRPASRDVRLSKREREILLWAAEGKSDQAIADLLNISYATVRFHLGNVYRKLDANERIFAVVKALRYGLITPSFVTPDEVAR